MQKQTMKVRLELLKKYPNGRKLFQRIAANGSSAWAWIGRPAFVVYDGVELKCLGEFDTQSEAERFSELA